MAAPRKGRRPQVVGARHDATHLTRSCTPPARHVDRRPQGSRAGPRTPDPSTATLTAPEVRPAARGTGTRPRAARVAVGYGACCQGALGLVAEAQPAWTPSRAVVETAVELSVPRATAFAITVDIVATHAPRVDDGDGAAARRVPPAPGVPVLRKADAR